MNGKTAKLSRAFISLLRRGSGKDINVNYVRNLVMGGNHRERGKNRARIRRMLEKASG